MRYGTDSVIAMAASLVKYMLGFFVVSAILWSIIKFSSRLFIWILSRVMKASVSFRVGGCNCLRDVAVKFNKGAVESISIREVRLSIRQSLVKIGAGLISRDPKLHLLICGLKVVTRASSKSTKKTSSKRTRSRKSRKIGRRKWMAVANIAKFLSVSVTETIVLSHALSLRDTASSVTCHTSVSSIRMFESVSQLRTIRASEHGKPLLLLRLCAFSVSAIPKLQLSLLRHGRN